jgi:anti-sigma factor RsiW
MRCEHAFDGGAYVLGALSPAERSAFEKHLAKCAECREAVASIAVLPGLLGRLSAADAGQVSDVTAEFATEQRIPKLVEAVGKARRRERWRVFAAAFVTACVALFAGLAAGSARGPDAPPAARVSSPAPSRTPNMQRMEPVTQTTVTAMLMFEEGSAGTTITMLCAYPPNSEHTRAYLFRLYALGDDGVSEQVGSWMAAPGDEVRVVGTVRLRLGDITRVELRAKDNRVLLAYDVP